MQKRIRIAIDSTMIDGRHAKGTAILARKEIQGLVNYKTEFDITLVHKFAFPEDPLYREFKEIIIPRIWNRLYGGVINEFLFFISFWIKIFLGRAERFDIYFVCYSKILPTFIFAPAKKFMFYPMDGGPLSAGFVLEKVKTPFPKYVLIFKNRIHRFLTLSKFGQRGVVELLNISEEKAPIIYCGADKSFHPLESDIEKEEARNFLAEKYKIPERFLLCVSRWDPHKNILGTVEAYKIYRQKRISTGLDFLPLVFLGGKHMPDYSARVDEVINKSGLNDYIFVATISQLGDMHKAYQVAELLIFASYYEGFGIPAIEGMRCGCPVICSNNSSLDEIGGPAALKVDPYSPNEIAEAILKLEGNTNLKAELVERGLEWSKQFTWESATESLVQVFRDLSKEIK